MADKFQNLSYFDHALEMLLLMIQEQELELSVPIDNQCNSLPQEPISCSSSILHQTIDLILRYTNNLSIFANCARKNEMSTWPRLFSILGDPKVLFKVISFSLHLK